MIQWYLGEALKAGNIWATDSDGDSAPLSPRGAAERRGAAASDVHYVLSKRPGEYRLWLERWAGHVEGLVGESVAQKVVEFPANPGA